MNDLIAKAHIYCINKHAHQKRKYSGEAYWIHPIRVAGLVTEITVEKVSSPQYEELIATALLHDVIEDTQTTYEELRDVFGYTIAGKVRNLTNTSKQDFPELNRAARKKKDREKLEKCPVDVRLIKYCDRWDNILDTFNFVADWNIKKPLPDAGFFYKYIDETKDLMKALNLLDLIETYGENFMMKYNLTKLLGQLREELNLATAEIKYV